MTESDELLGATLRQAMTDAADAVQPGPDGLDLIRARIAGRPPRPRLVAAAAYGAERIRYLSWRGHWARPGAARPRRPGPDGRRYARRPGAQWGITGLRLVAALGGIAVIVGVSFAVQPFRHAIIAASSTMLNGGSGAPGDGAGTDGNGTQAPGGGGQPPAASATAGRGKHASPGATGQPTAGAVNPDATASCLQATQAAAPGSTPTAAGSTPAGSAPPAPAATASGAVSCPAASGSAAPSSAAGTDPAPTDSNWYTAPAGGGYASSPTPTPAYSTPHRWWPWPTPTPTPTDTPTPAPTPTPTDSSDTATPAPSAS